MPLNKILDILSDEKILEKISKITKLITAFVVLINALLAMVKGIQKAIFYIQSFISKNIKEKNKKDDDDDEEENNYD